jgi:hypothetical protein
MKSTILSSSKLTPEEAADIVAGFLSARRAKHGDATMTAPQGGEGGDNGGGAGGDSGDNGGNNGGGDSGPATDPTDPNYFPPNTAVAEMTERQQAAYWRNQTKVANARVPKDLPALQQKAREYDELIAASRTEGEAAIDEALDIGREEGRAEVRQEAAAEFLRSQLSTGRTEDQVATLMRGVSPAGFITDEGKIDYSGIRTFAATLGGGTGGSGPDLGQGRRGGQGKPSVAAGKSLFQERNPSRAAASANQ